MEIREIPTGSLKRSTSIKCTGNRSSAAGAGSITNTDITATDTAALEDYIKDLQNCFPSAQIQVAELSGTQGIKDYAQSHYGPLQIVLSPKTIKRMMEDPEFKKECERLLKETRKSLYDKAGHLSMAGNKVAGSGMALDEDGNITEWTAIVREQKPHQPWLPTAAATKDGLISRIKTKDGRTIVFKKKLNYRPARDLSRIAQAESTQLVRTAMSGIRASIYQLKSSGGDKRAVSQLVGQAEQVLSKARVKIKNLEKENLLKTAQKRAEQENHMARAAHMQRVLKERQVKRKVREYTQIRDHYPTPQELRQEEERAKEWAEQVTGDFAGSGSSDGLTSYSPSGSAVSMGGADAAGGVPNSGMLIHISL